jgi:hypothetical protein
MYWFHELGFYYVHRIGDDYLMNKGTIFAPKRSPSLLFI